MKIIIALICSLTMAAASVFGTTHTVSTSGFAFSPSTITVSAGDTVTFLLASIHNAVEVDQSTWNTNGTSSNGGFSVPFGGGTIVLDAVGTYYYVCQNHVLMGMKGIITVIPSSPAPNSITVESMCDRDGNLSTTSDRVAKNWALKLYKDSVGSGIVVDSLLSGTSFTANDLSAGTYVAVEADSLSWTHISVNLDGIGQGGTASHQWSITVATGETHVIGFVNFTTNAIINSGLSFLPDSLSVYTGEAVHFVLEAAHTAREVSESTWLANDTASNGGFDLPSGGGTAIMAQSGIHYYVCVSDASVGMKGRIIVPGPPPFVSVKDSLVAGWNMVSLPVQVADSRASVLFPAATSPAYAYEGHYISNSALSNGIGYWLKFPSSNSVLLTGLEVVQDTITIAQGWNMIGSISASFPRTAIVSQPAGIIGSSIFGYNGAYFLADSVLPGKGYWVRSSQPGKLIFDASSASAFPAKTGSDLPSRTNTVVITDAIGRSQTLFIAGDDGDYPLRDISTELPPVPPQGGFDVRFASGQQMIFAHANIQQTFPLQVSCASYPLTLTWDIQPMKQSIFLLHDDMQTELRGSGDLTITDANQVLSIVTSPIEHQPTAYALDEAFPNPFNPSTTIRYALPVESRVVLRIYNIIGQLVASLKDGVQAPGHHAITWNAGDYVSGVYFVRMEAASSGEPSRSFTKVNKIMLQE